MGTVSLPSPIKSITWHFQKGVEDEIRRLYAIREYGDIR
jgi:hypothetical protein